MASYIKPQAQAKNVPYMVPQDLQKLGFAAPSLDPVYRVIMATSGREKSGKTNFAFTQPGPIGCISLDTGTKGVVEKFVRGGKVIYLKEHQSTSRMVNSSKSIKTDAEKVWNEVEQEFVSMLRSPSIRSIVMDTASEAYDLLKLARFGKLTQVMPHHYGPVNDEFQDWIRMAFEYDKNVVLLHKVKKEYVSKSGKKTKSDDMKDSVWSGEYERAGYNGMGFLVEVNAEHYRDHETRNFCMRLVDSRINGLKVFNEEIVDSDMVDFATIASTFLFPETDIEFWQD